MRNESRDVAVVDAANGTELEITIRLDARGTALRGSYVGITSDTDLMLGRISEVAMVNPIHQNETFTPLIMRNGRIPNWSGDVDIERGTVEIIAVTDENGKRIPVRRNPKSGTSVELADQAVINRFASEREYFLNLGYIPNSGGLLASIANRHFGPRSDDLNHDTGGWSEARHTAILGQNGSAKTVLLTAIIAGRLAAHPQMGLLMPDTSSDLCDPDRHNAGDYRWNYGDVLKAKGIAIETIKINDVKLTSPHTLTYKLGPVMKRHLNCSSEKGRELASRIVDNLFEKQVDVSQFTADKILEKMKQHIPFCWNDVAMKQKAADNLSRSRFNADIEHIRKLFEGRWPLWSLIKDVLEHGRKVALDFEGVINDDHRFIMREIIENMTRQAQLLFHAKRMANAMFVLDEASRWVPEGKDESDDGSAELIIDGFRTTRKYGLGWIVVAQSPTGISKSVLRECRTKYCGRNLGLGIDSEHLQDMLGKDGARAYAQLAIQGGFYWVAKGPDCNLGGEDKWFAIHPFSGDATKAFIDANPHIFGIARAAVAAE